MRLFLAGLRITIAEWAFTWHDRKRKRYGLPVIRQALANALDGRGFPKE